MLFTRVPEILDALLPAAPPVRPACNVGAGQLYVVPAGTISAPFVGVTVNVTPPQTAVALFEIVGVGFTVNVRVNVGPEQLPNVGVTVYVAVWFVLVGFVRVPPMLD